MNFGKTLLVAAVAAMVMTSGCGYNNVPPGYVGIKVNFYGGNKGVEDNPVVTGMQWYNPFMSAILEYPTFNQTAVWTENVDEGSPTNEEVTFGSSEGMPFTADVSLSYELIAEKVPAFYVKFRNDDLDAFTHGYMRNIAREAFSDIGPKYTAEELYSTKTEQFRREVWERVKPQVAPYGVNITQFGLIGRPRPPKEIIDRINAKVGSIQKAQQAENELRERTAEAAKRVADAKGDAESQVARARGEAEANRVLAESITPSLIAWRKLEIERQEIAKWDGVKPKFVGGNLPTPIVDMTK